MRLLIATHQFEIFAGSELHTADLCRGFRRAGHEVAMFTLKPGPATGILGNIPVFSLSELRSLREEDFDLIYLHHATCEVVLGLVFSGKVPIIRGYLGVIPAQEKPTNASFLSGEVYLSEEVAEQNYADRHPDVPSLIARSVYDDQLITPIVAHGEPALGAPNFAVVSNHLDRDLAAILEAAAAEDLCRFTHFGWPNNNLAITTELLTPFDAVITIGRTVLLTAALGKPVYICDVHGADGWLTRDNFARSQSRNFSGRAFGIKDWTFIRRQLLDTNQWPSLNDLTWLRGSVERHHSLSRRIEQLEGFFADVIGKAPPPMPIPGGYEGVLRFLEQKDRALQALGRIERRRLKDAVKEARDEARAQAERKKERNRRVQELNQQIKELKRQIGELELRNRSLES